MNYVDILIIIPFVWAIYRGYSQGIIVQLGGLAALVVGIWLSWRYGGDLGAALGFDPRIATVGGFLIILVITILLIAIVGKIIKQVFKFAGLGMLDSVGGVLLSVVKTALIVSILLVLFDVANSHSQMVDPATLSASMLYEPVKNILACVFPYVDLVRENLSESTDILWSLNKG